MVPRPLHCLFAPLFPSWFGLLGGAAKWEKKGAPKKLNIPRVCVFYLSVCVRKSTDSCRISMYSVGHAWCQLFKYQEFSDNNVTYFLGDQDADGGCPDLRHMLDALADVHDGRPHCAANQHVRFFLSLFPLWIEGCGFQLSQKKREKSWKGPFGAISAPFSHLPISSSCLLSIPLQPSTALRPPHQTFPPFRSRWGFLRNFLPISWSFFFETLLSV